MDKTVHKWDHFVSKLQMHFAFTVTHKAFDISEQGNCKTTACSLGVHSQWFSL